MTSPTMPILEFVLGNAACFLPQPLLTAFEAGVVLQVQRFFVFLVNWAGDLFERCCGNSGEEVPEFASEVVGADDTLSEIRQLLMDESVGIIGICGMGGVGKTTILQKINNVQLAPGWRASFDLVIWVTVSRIVSIPKIQKTIAGRLGIILPDSSTEKENGDVLFKALSKKRFLLLLDDLWEDMDLQVTVGIPRPGRPDRAKSKILFTTRSMRICGDMDARKVMVNPLDFASSWRLFCTKLSSVELFRTNTAIRELAEQVVNKCGGLPLSLITVGRAMADRVHIRDWEYAIEALDQSAELLHGMDKVVSCLKFSYDNLKNDNMRSALLLCAMYHEDQEIWCEEIIKYWFGEGLLGDCGGPGVGDVFDRARKRGQFMVRELQDACLLEPGTWSLAHNFRLHDSVRDMGRWLNSHGFGRAVDASFLVYDGRRAANNVWQTEGQEHVKRICAREVDLLDEETSDLIRGMNCPSNRTLLLIGVAGFGPSIFQWIVGSMKATLRVLDLSCSRLEDLPGEIGLLVELRFLELGSTHIRALPKELGKLVNLQALGMRFLTELKEVPRESLVGLSSLRFLDMFGTPYDWEVPDSEDSGGIGGGGYGQLKLSDLISGLRRLQELHIHLGTPRVLERVLKSDRLCMCTRSLYLEKLNHRRHGQREEPLYGENGGHLLHSIFDSKTLRFLRNLYLGGDDSHPWVGVLRVSLRQLPRLEILSLWSFRGMPGLVLMGTDVDAVGDGSVGRRTPPSSPNPCSILYRFFLSRFDGLKALKLVGAFPCLQGINLDLIGTLEEIEMDASDEAEFFQGGGGLLYNYFPMLREITLSVLPALKSIGPRRLRLPELRLIAVHGCPELRRIPLDDAGVPKLEMIRGEGEWWDAVEFAGKDEGSTTKATFGKLFVESSL